MTPSSAATTPVPLSTIQLDERIRSIPIGLRYDKNTDNDTRVQDALLPYFALQFTTVPTSGSRLECGLHALSISFHAAQNTFRKPGTPEKKLISIIDWRTLLNSVDYEHACHEMAARQPGLSNHSRDNYAQGLIYSRENLDNAEISCLLQAANFRLHTNFQLGFVFAGYRGRMDPTNRQKFDNRHVLNARATMSDRPVGSGPTIWIFNNNLRAIQLARDAPKSWNHWEGFSNDPRFTSFNRRVRVVHNYGIGHLVEEDIRRGVWFLTEASSHSKNPSHIKALPGAFLRETEAPPGVTVTSGHRYMRTCNGLKGLVLEANMVRINATDRMPTRNTDPTEDKFKIMGEPLPLPGFIPHPRLPPHSGPPPPSGSSRNPPLEPPSHPGPSGPSPPEAINNTPPNGAKKGDSKLKEDTLRGAVTNGEASKGTEKPAGTIANTAKDKNVESDELEEGEIGEEADAPGRGGKEDPKNGKENEGNTASSKPPIEIPRGITTKDPRIDPHFRNRALKLFRVIPPTTKAGNPSGGSLKEILSGLLFKFEDGEFMLDLKKRGDRAAVVRNIDGLEGSVRLRRLQALKNPWGLPNLLPLAPRRNYMVPEEDADAIAWAQFLDKNKEIDFSSMDLLREGLERMLNAKREKETYHPELAQITCDLPPGDNNYGPSFEKGEIVRVLDKGPVDDDDKGGKWCRVVNYEGLENLISEDGIKDFDNQFWGLAPIYRAQLDLHLNQRKHDRLSSDEEDDDSGPKKKKARRECV